MKSTLATAIALALAVGGAYAAEHSGGDMEKNCITFEQLDTNGDGQVSHEEAVNFMGEQQKKMDKDKDGKVSKNEFNSFLSDLGSSQRGM